MDKHLKKNIDFEFEITEKRQLTNDIYELTLCGPGSSEIKHPGQFINIALDGKYLRRPISVCDKFADEISIVFKVVGSGTKQMSTMQVGHTVKALCGLGNGFDVDKSGTRPIIIGGGIGVPPLFLLAKELIRKKIRPTIVLGFNGARDVILVDDFKSLGCNVTTVTVDGSYGETGFVTDHLSNINHATYFYTCGPEPMLRAVYNATGGPINKGGLRGEFSFEARMGCGFGACMGCSCKTITGFKRICKDGPVIGKEELLWNN